MKVENVFTEFLINKGLYDSQSITRENVYQLIDLVDGKVKINCYCPNCKEKRIFNGKPIFYHYTSCNSFRVGKLADAIKNYNGMNANDSHHSGQEKWSWINRDNEYGSRVMTFSFSCSLDDNHHLDYTVLTNENVMIKIGQFPTVADLTFPELEKYRKIISNDDMKEIKRAIGLYASGIGVGAYVYLRRIVERLIIKAQMVAISDGKVMENDIKNEKVVDRIKLLKDYLPDILVTNSVLYGIISKGIHELSEQECIEYFPVLKDVIFLILEKWEEERKKKEAEKRLSASLSKIASNIK